jgi:uncharacterized DUF497 family protein
MATGGAAADLEDVQTVDLMSELLRRLKCSQKPDKRLIFIGNLTKSVLFFYFSDTTKFAHASF